MNARPVVFRSSRSDPEIPIPIFDFWIGVNSPIHHQKHRRRRRRRNIDNERTNERGRKLADFSRMRAGKCFFCNFYSEWILQNLSYFCFLLNPCVLSLLHLKLHGRAIFLNSKNSVALPWGTSLRMHDWLDKGEKRPSPCEILPHDLSVTRRVLYRWVTIRQSLDKIIFGQNQAFILNLYELTSNSKREHKNLLGCSYA